MPARVSGARGVHLIAKRRPDGTVVALVNNMTDKATQPFKMTAGGAARTMALPAYGFATLSSK